MKDISAPHKLASEIILLVIATVVVALRFIARKKLKMGWKADDWLALAAFLLLAGYMGGLWWAYTEHISGFNFATESLQQITEILKLTYFNIYCMSVIITLARLSVIFLYYRIFGHYDNFRRGLWVMGSLSIAWVTTIIFLNTFRCDPIAAAYDPLVKGKCLNMTTLFAVTESINCALDGFLVLMPLWRIPFMNLPIRDRIGLCIVFLTGGFVAVTSLVRIVLTYDVETVQSAFWLTLQLATAVICCCLPTLRTYLPKHIPTPSSITSYLRSSILRKSSGTSTSGDSSSHLEKRSQDSDSDKASSGHSVRFITTAGAGFGTDEQV